MKTTLLFFLPMFTILYNLLSSSLLAFFKEKDIIKYLSNFNGKMKYEIPAGKGLANLKIIKLFYEAVPNEPEKNVVLAILNYFEERKLLKTVQPDIESV